MRGNDGFTIKIPLFRARSEDKIADTQEKAEKCIRMLDSEDSLEASAKTISKVKDALKDVQDCFESFGYSLNR
jgi:hypothetical protein